MTSLRLIAPQTKGHTSVATLTDYWYVACRSSELGKQPLARTVLGVPLVVFRAAGGRAAVMLDRCPHRNVPLSEGTVRDGTLECAYHGWRFDADGQCRLIPGLCEATPPKGRHNTAYRVVEQDGLVWVFMNPEVEPTVSPHALPHLHDPRYASVHQDLDMPCTVHACAENALDVPHTAFLHRGLFRGASSKRSRIKAVVKRTRSGVEAEYVGESRPGGLAGRILAPRGGVVTHFDRFLMPSIAQVEYRLGDAHLLVNAIFTPISDFLTRQYGVVSWRLPVPPRVVQTAMTPVVSRILKQDAAMLALQTRNIQRFGGEQYVSTEIDVLGPEIWRLMKAAERGQLSSVKEESYSVDLEV
ncbi:MAG: aromatic ring-hydroxylating dioxygenase subunit alpha [Myxococcota bacterium]